MKIFHMEFIWTHMVDKMKANMFMHRTEQEGSAILTFLSSSPFILVCIHKKCPSSLTEALLISKFIFWLFDY